MRKLMLRERDERLPGSRLGVAILWAAVPFFTYEIAKLAFFHIASGKDIKFPAVMAWPVAIATGFIVFSILMGFATSLSPKNRERFALILLVIAVAVEIWK